MLFYFGILLEIERFKAIIFFKFYLQLKHFF